MIETAVIILHYANGQDTRECLESLFRGDYQERQYRIIIIANSDEDNFTQSLSRDYPFVKVIKPPKNLGFAGGNNLGMNMALEEGCKHLILLNNDTIASQNLISRIIKKAERNSLIGLLSPKIYFSKGYEYYLDKYLEDDRGKVIWYAGGKIDWANVYPSHKGVDEVDKGQFDEETETEFATGCCMYIRDETVKKIGFLDEKYFMYFEDADYSVRAKKRGLKVFYYPDSCLWHKNAASSGKPGSPMHVYYQTRNRLYFGMKHAPLLTKKSLFLESLRNLSQNTIRRKAVLNYYSGKMGYQKL